MQPEPFSLLLLESTYIGTMYSNSSFMELQDSEGRIQVYISRDDICPEENKDLFSYLLPVPGMEYQISQILLGVKSRLGNSVTSLTGNILIQGEEGSGKTVFATSLIKAIEKEVGNEDAKIGKISASSLNGKDFAALIPQIDGGYLIIDKAGELNRETALRMSQLMEQNTRGMVILLEDTRAGIRKAMQLEFGFA